MCARRRRSIVALLVLLGARGAAGAAGSTRGRRGGGPLLCPLPPARCDYKDSNGENHFHRIDGEDPEIQFTGTFLMLKCQAGLTLDSASLPRFPQSTLVPRVQIQSCPAPDAPYSHVLDRLNVTVLDELDLVFVPPAPALRADHFYGLEKLTTLKVSGRKVLDPHLELLRPLPALRELTLLHVRLQPEAVETLPPNLTFLSLSYCELHKVSGPALARLAALRQLVLRDRTVDSPPPVGQARALRVLELYAPLNELPTFENLEHVTLVTVRNVTLRGSCDSLQQLHVRSLQLSALPAGWLQTADGGPRCPRLRYLSLKMLRVKSLPESLLAGDGLHSLTVTECPFLKKLPAKLFLATRNLRHLVIKNNNLVDVPGQIFVPLHHLKELDLSSNKLRDGAPGGRAAGLLESVGELTKLQKLVLDKNEIGDMCRRAIGTATSSNNSHLHKLKKLRTLSLAHTGASTLCDDWRRELPALTTIDFSHNKLTSLTYSDMQWYDCNRTVKLGGNLLRVVSMSRKEYNYDVGTTTEVKLEFNKVEIDCTCDTYWLARALRERRLRASLPGVTCRGTGAALHSAPLDDMSCDKPALCDTNCTCTLLPGDADTVAVSCRGRSTLPDLNAAIAYAPRVELNLTSSNVATLPADLPPRLQLLDLRNNSVAALPSNTSTALLAHSRRVLLAGNPLACACDVTGTRPALLRELLVKANSSDLSELTCEDGTRVSALPPCAARGAWLWAAGSAAAVVALALVVAWVMTRRGGQLRFKVFLFTRGLFTSCVGPDDDDDSEYDVYVAFSRHDFAIAKEIVATLESGQRPLRVCAHHRDWRFGDWIPVQIARSVRQSRRTLVLVSEHFVRSRWARAVLREASARALRDLEPRLIVVHLQPTHALPSALDSELRHYITTNTCARWGEPAFWERLRLVLPPGRPARLARAPPLSLVTAHPAPPAPLNQQPSSTTPVINLSQMMEYPSPIKKAPSDQLQPHDVYTGTGTIHKL